jgi:hypothetical protein
LWHAQAHPPVRQRYHVRIIAYMEGPAAAAQYAVHGGQVPERGGPDEALVESVWVGLVRWAGGAAQDTGVHRLHAPAPEIHHNARF